jgi:hypothetical protein
MYDLMYILILIFLINIYTDNMNNALTIETNKWCIECLTNTDFKLPIESDLSNPLGNGNHLNTYLFVYNPNTQFEIFLHIRKTRLINYNFQ